MATPSGTWEGASQDASSHRLPESTPTLPETQPDYAPAVSIWVRNTSRLSYTYEPSQSASTSAILSPPTAPSIVARDQPLDEVRSVRTELPALCSYFPYSSACTHSLSTRIITGQTS